MTEKQTLILRKLAKIVNKSGGWKELTRKNEWERIYSAAKYDYEVAWMPVILALNEYKTVIEPVTPPIEGKLTGEFWKEVMSREVTVMRGFWGEIWRGNREVFDMERVKEVRTEEMTGKEYRDMEVGRGLVASMGDVDLSAQEMGVLRRALPENLCFQSRTDCLRFTRIHIPGLTLPLLHLRSRGSWTGLHQAELCLTSVIVNHGPGVCEWFIVTAAHVPALRELVLARIGVDVLHVTGGFLWVPEYVLREGKIPFACVDLQPGDVMYLGPGGVQWSRCETDTLLTAHSICPATLSQFQACFHRSLLNRSLSIESLLQIHTLSLDLLNTSLSTLPPDLTHYLLTRLNLQFHTENLQYFSSKLPKNGVFPGHQVRRCEKCRYELFFTYIICNTCAIAMCFDCISKHLHTNLVVCTQFLQENYEKLRKRVENREEIMFDPTFNRHFNALEREKEAKIRISPYNGAKNCIFYEKIREIERNEDNGVKNYVIPKRGKA